MPRQPETWFRADRGWYVQIAGKQTFLGEHPKNAPPPRRNGNGRWNAPQSNPTGPLLRNSEGNPWRMASVNCLFQRVRRELGRRRLVAAGLMPAPVPRINRRPEWKDAAVRQGHEAKVLARRQEVHRLAWEHGTKYSLYAFRHAFCTEALESGVDAVTVS